MKNLLLASFFAIFTSSAFGALTDGTYTLSCTAKKNIYQSSEPTVREEHASETQVTVQNGHLVQNDGYGSSVTIRFDNYCVISGVMKWYSSGNQTFVALFSIFDPYIGPDSTPNGQTVVWKDNCRASKAGYSVVEARDGEVFYTVAPFDETHNQFTRLSICSLHKQN